jgi:hypothetical protein
MAKASASTVGCPAWEFVGGRHGQVHVVFQVACWISGEMRGACNWAPGGSLWLILWGILILVAPGGQR